MSRNPTIHLQCPCCACNHCWTLCILLIRHYKVYTDFVNTAYVLNHMLNPLFYLLICEGIHARKINILEVDIFV